LQGSDDSGEDTDDAAFGAAGDGARVWGFGIHAAIAGAVFAATVGVGKVRGEDGEHSLEAEDRAVDVGLFEDDAGIVDAVAGGEVVGAVDDDVVVFDQIEDVGAVDDGFEFDDVDVGVEVLEAFGGGFYFVFADGGHAEENLALEITGTDDVDVGQADGADAGGGEVEADGAAETTSADAQHFGVDELELAGHADLGEEEMAFVAVDLFGVELSGLGHKY